MLTMTVIYLISFFSSILASILVLKGGDAHMTKENTARVAIILFFISYIPILNTLLTIILIVAVFKAYIDIN